jgi:hypothetical protein
MKKRAMILVSLIAVAVLILAVNIQPVFATGEAIQLTKTAQSIEPSGSNYKITYQFTAQNTGLSTSKSLTKIYVDDKIHGSVVGSRVVDWDTFVLPVGSTTSVLTWEYTTTPADIDTDSVTGAKTVTNIATVHSVSYTTIGGTVIIGNTDVYDNSEACTVTLTGPISSLPEMPAGILFGIGLAGIGGFIVFKKRSKSVTAQ